MANTSFLRYGVEPFVREQLAQRFRQPFAPKSLRLFPGGEHEFDAVSADGSIVGSIKASSGLTRGGNLPTGKVATCLNEVYFLTLVAAEHRMLILTNPDFYKIFTRVTAGQIATGVGVELLTLPAELQSQVDRVVAAASREMSNEVAPEAAALRAEEAGEAGVDVP